MRNVTLTTALAGALLLTLTGCGDTTKASEPKADPMAGCLAWIAEAHPENSVPEESCLAMMENDPEGFVKTFSE